MSQEVRNKKWENRIENTFDKLAAKEWLVTNGLGGYAAGTLSGANTRRYHGLLIAALHPPTYRTVLVSKIEETILKSADELIELSSNEYCDAIHPTGFRFLTSFERDPVPTFHFAAGEYQLVKRIFMPQGHNCTVVQYINTGSITTDLRLRLFLNHRDYHHLAREDSSFIYKINRSQDRAAMITAYAGSAPLFLRYTNGNFTEHRDWYRQYKYRHESYRGLDDTEDLFTPGYIDIHLIPGEEISVCFSTEEHILHAHPNDLLDREIRRIQHIKELATGGGFGKHALNCIALPGYGIRQVLEDLYIAADQFIVHRKSSGGETIIAGYHWFTDWGRDTMIAMRGLVIAPGKKELAESILRTFLQYLDQGMLPNRFPDQGEEPEYNTIDATLWLFIVLHEYAEQFADYRFIDIVFDSLTSIIDHHIRGTRYHIHMLDNGLLYGGDPTVQLTWMDAKVGDYVVTPRVGCAVEINALWYNALRIYNAFAVKCHRVAVYPDELAERVKTSFHQYFFNGAYLHDVVVPGQFTDDAFRPNQLYAISLPFSMLEEKESKRLLQLVREKLVTPYGLRSLDPAHPDFIGTYGGDQWHRDLAYHQGTVWSYLIGEYWLAQVKVNGSSIEVKEDVASGMIPLLQHFYNDDCIYGINEIFDGDNPGIGRGCVHQAWSVGMLLRVLQELSKS